MIFRSKWWPQVEPCANLFGISQATNYRDLSQDYTGLRRGSLQLNRNPKHTTTLQTLNRETCVMHEKQKVFVICENDRQQRTVHSNDSFIWIKDKYKITVSLFSIPSFLLRTTSWWRNVLVKTVNSRFCGKHPVSIPLQTSADTSPPVLADPTLSPDWCHVKIKLEQS